MNSLEFNHFRIRDKWTQIVELGSNISFNTYFGATEPTNAATIFTYNTIQSETAFKKGIKKIQLYLSSQRR